MGNQGPNFANDNKPFDHFGAESGYISARPRGEKNRTALYAEVLRLRDVKTKSAQRLEEVTKSGAPQSVVAAANAELTEISRELKFAEEELEAVNNTLNKDQKVA